MGGGSHSAMTHGWHLESRTGGFALLPLAKPLLIKSARLAKVPAPSRPACGAGDPVSSIRQAVVALIVTAPAMPVWVAPRILVQDESDVSGKRPRRTVSDGLLPCVAAASDKNNGAIVLVGAITVEQTPQRVLITAGSRTERRLTASLSRGSCTMPLALQR